MDLHCNITPDMLALSDGLFAIKENPHIDMGAAGYLVTKTLIGKIRGDIKPVTSMAHIPMMVASSNSGTFYDPMKSIMAYLKQYGEERGFIDVSLGHGFSANDTPWAGMTILITAERDTTAECKELANYVWSRRFELTPKPLSAAEAIDKALAGVKNGYAVINESPDNPGSGCPGDSTHLLRALMEKDVPRSIFSLLVDGETVQQAHKAGVGATIHVRMGGKSDPICGEPIEADVEVLNLSNGRCLHTGPAAPTAMMDVGLCCRLRHSNVEIVVCTRRDQTWDDRGLMVTGADINDYQLVCLKSSNHFRGWFQSRADIIVTAETPGLRPSDLSLQPFKEIMRPVFPLDRDMEFTAL
jgi:microcystin degradation protein MlrC